MGGEYLHAEELKKMITHDLEFAFMATCHDPIAAKVFLTAGAKQVISVHQSDSLMKKAETLFTATFYSNLWKENSVVTDCFKTAKMAVEVNFGPE